MNCSATNLSVACRVRGHNTPGRAHDLTREGCLIDCGNGSLVAGDSVALRFGNGVRLAGRVTLLHGRIARIEFDSPLHEAVYAHLVASAGAPAPPVERCFSRSRRIAGAARRLA
jgi:hypothetical protein